MARFAFSLVARTTTQDAIRDIYGFLTMLPTMETATQAFVTTKLIIVVHELPNNVILDKTRTLSFL